ncbi:MAG TPA: metallophosphoesterase family protein [Kiritimatiellia bacterium]|nr:metallophosphoesterase family protein [Kiritimatiellia bacterium]
MRIAVLADIHSNWHALHAVVDHLLVSRPDRVLLAGDVINRGPRPRDCLEFVLERIANHGWLVIRGNHEDYVLDVLNETGRPEWEIKLREHVRWTRARVEDLLPTFDAWPAQLDLHGPDHGIIRCVHASMHGNRSGLYEFMDDEEFLAKCAPAVPVLCVGHTHVPFIRWVEGRLVVNAGAVGMPFDRDRRASYALLEWTESGWRPEIIRVPYDIAATERDYHQTGYLRDGGIMTPLIHREFELAAPQLGYWHRNYEPLVASGNLTLEQSVAIMLAGTP